MDCLPLKIKYLHYYFISLYLFHQFFWYLFYLLKDFNIASKTLLWCVYENLCICVFIVERYITICLLQCEIPLLLDLRVKPFLVSLVLKHDLWYSASWRAAKYFITLWDRKNVRQRNIVENSVLQNLGYLCFV